MTNNILPAGQNEALVGRTLLFGRPDKSVRPTSDGRNPSPGWLAALLLLSLGCQSFPGLAPRPSAEELWVRGQEAMHQGQIQLAIDFYEEGLAADAGHSRTHLSLAAAFLESGQKTLACTHLAQFVAAQPTNLAARSLLAELLLQLNQPQQAKEEWERFLAEAQEQGESAVLEKIRGHSKLAALAEAAENDFHFHLHRGIGLYLLAGYRAEFTEEDSLPVPEGLLCKAAGELALARLLEPQESKPCWYLYKVWRGLGQRQQAQRWLHEAEQAAPFSSLTPAELRSLILATNQSPTR